MEIILYMTTLASANVSETIDSVPLKKNVPIPQYMLDIIGLMLGIMPPLTLAFGTFGNIMIILLFSRQRSVSSFNVFFKALAVSDLTLIWTLHNVDR